MLYCNIKHNYKTRGIYLERQLLLIIIQKYKRYTIIIVTYIV